MKERLPIILSATALAVALFGATPLGQAARHLAGKVPPFAQKAGYANNAGAVGGIKASRAPRAGYLVALGANGKFPTAVGQVGPKGSHGVKGDSGPMGPSGPTGPNGPPGLAMLQVVTQGSSTNSDSLKGATASCPSGKKVLGGGAFQGATGEPIAIIKSQPDGDGGWTAQAREIISTSANWSVTTYAICAAVAS